MPRPLWKEFPHRDHITAMSGISIAAAIDRTPEERAALRRLMLFFALVYVAEGAGQTDGLIAQPLNYYLKQSYGWSPVEITAYLTVLNLPWFIKPLYGAVSDFIPFLGYRRKTYLIAANAAAALGYIAIAQATSPGTLIWLLLLTAYGMAVSSTLCGALLVENGQRFRATGAFVNQQWLWYNIAAMACALLGGFLIEYLAPVSAVHVSAAIVASVPVAVVFGTTMLVSEKKIAFTPGGLNETFAGLVSAFRTRDLWLIAGFLFFYYFSPGFVTPLYFYMTDTLKFSQGFIGELNAVSSAGWIAGALLYGALMETLSSRALLNVSIAIGMVATLSFLVMSDATTAITANFINGVSLMIASVATLSLAADYCPKRSEGFVFAALMSVTNIAGSLADNVGSYLYERVFDGRLYPLIAVSAIVTGLAFGLVPLLRLSGKPQGEPVLEPWDTRTAPPP
jgi:MFS family permease